MTQATLTDPNVKKPVSLLVSTANYDGESTTVTMAHLSKRLPQTPLNLTFTDDRLHFAATAEGDKLPDVAVDVSGFIDTLGDVGFDSGSDSEYEEGSAQQLQYGASSDEEEDSEDDSSDDEAREEQYLLADAMAGGSDGDSSDDSSDDSSTSSDSGAEDGADGAVALAYVGDDEQGNAQLVTSTGDLFTVAGGMGEDGEDGLYLVQGGLDNQLAGSADSESDSDDDSGDSEDSELRFGPGNVAIPHGPIMVETPSRGTKRRRRSSAAGGSSKKAAY